MRERADCPCLAERGGTWGQILLTTRAMAVKYINSRRLSLPKLDSLGCGLGGFSHQQGKARSRQSADNDAGGTEAYVFSNPPCTAMGMGLSLEVVVPASENASRGFR